MSPHVYLIELFSKRPTLHDVALKQLRFALRQQFPDLELDPEICVITRMTAEGNQRAETLYRALQQAVCAGKTPRLRSEYNTLVLNPDAADAASTSIDFDRLNTLIDTVSLELNEQFQRALVEFWGTPMAGGQTPWSAVAEALQRNFSDAATGTAALDEGDREFLRTVAAFPDKAQRDFMLQINQPRDGVVRACIPRQAGDTSGQRVELPMVAATGVWHGAEVFFSWQSPGAIVKHQSLTDLMASVVAAGLGNEADEWTLHEPEDDLFDALARSVLARQLLDAGREGPGHLDFNELECRLSAATDITPVVLASVPGMENADPLPDWLQSASPADRLDFSRRMIALAGVQAKAGGKAFNDDLPPLLGYALQNLQRALLADHPEAVDVRVADLDVVINKVVAVAMPGGGQVIAAGAVEPVRMTVAEFALENLSGLPAGAMKVVHREGAQLPEWFTADYLRLLVCQIDIGRHYPEWVKRYLLTDPQEAARRQVLYTDQLRVQLPLMALEQTIRSRQHFCTRAYGLVAALMQTPRERPSALRETTLRPLAFHATAGARPDVVANMFVIADRDVTQRPIVLYRPSASRSLTEFSSWDALRAAIVQPGDLHDEVLTWMDDHARQVYANGGFDQPHIVRVGQGSEFAPLETPPPAQLSFVEVTEDPLAALFKANASALVELADRQSTSNAESRWNLLKRGGWLTLDAVMPFISGPAGNALWLVQLMTMAQDSLAAGTEGSPGDSTPSWGNMLLTLAMLLLHGGLADPAAAEGGRSPAVLRPVLADLLTTPVGDTEPAIALKSGHAPTVTTPAEPELDFAWSRPDLKLTPRQTTLLEAFKITPRPELPQPSTAPGTAGLYEVQGKWYAPVGDAVYQVRVRDEAVQIVHPDNIDMTGPLLLKEGQQWRLDLALRLLGGGPKRSARQLALENAALLKRITLEKAELLKRQNDLYIRIVDTDNRIDGLPIEEHQGIISSLESDIRSVIDIIDRKNALDQQLRPADRTSDKSYAKDLQGVTRRICLLEGVLLSDMLKLAKEDLVRMRALSNNVTSANVALYLGLFEKSLQLQETGVRWSIIREGLWQRLRSVPKVGEAYWREEAVAFYNSRMFSLVDWRASRMWSSLELCFSAESILDGRKGLALKRLLSDDPLHGALTSQAELERPNDYTIAEQIGVLESSLREYDRASIVALAAFESEPEAVNTAHFQRFFDDLSAISDRAEHRLSELIRESEEPADTPAEYVPRVTQPRKRVIKTRGQRTLIGRLREGEEPLLGEVVEVTAASGDRVVGSYHQHAEGEWVELEDQRPKLVNRDSIVPLAELMRRSRALLERVEPDIANAVRQSRRANEPEDMEDILVQKADKLRELLDKLQIHVDDPHAEVSGRVALGALLTDLRAGESRLREQGRQLRIEMIKRQPPTASRISYLDRQHEVHIARVEGRKNMSGARRNDFVQEYTIRDKDDHLLWWAHFHYPSEGAAADAFTAAHLKLPEQRLMGYRAMLKAAKDNKEVVSIYRSAIGKDLAQRLFLHLAE